MATLPDMIAAEAAPARRGPGLKATLIAIAMLLAAGLIAWFVYHQVRGRFLESTNDAYLRADSVAVSSRVAGYVEQVGVGDNQDVAAGQLLVRLDVRDYRAQAAQYVAQQDVSAANAANVRASILEQQAVVEQARAQLDGAAADQRFADEQVARYGPLVASGAERGERLAALRRDAAEARSKAAAARAQLSSAERRIGSLEAQVRQARAQGEAVDAQLAAARVNVGSALLRASVAGRVGDRTVRVGQFVQPGMRLMSIVPLDALYVVANFKETQIGAMRRGQPVDIRVDALPGGRVTGHVDSMSPGTGAEFSLLPPQNATGNFTKIVQRVPVRIAIDATPETRRALLAGLSATVTVDTRAQGRR